VLGLRFSLQSLLGAVAFVAVSLASLLHPWRAWCPAIVLTGVLLLMLLAIPCSIYAHSRGRAFWVGFTIVGWGYFLLAYAPWMESRIGHQLLADPTAEALCFAVTGSLGDFPHFLQVTHALCMFLLAYLGGLVASRCEAQRNTAACNQTALKQSWKLIRRGRNRRLGSESPSQRSDHTRPRPSIPCASRPTALQANRFWLLLGPGDDTMTIDVRYVAVLAVWSALAWSGVTEAAEEPVPTREFEIKHDRAWLGGHEVDLWGLRCGSALHSEAITERHIRNLDNMAAHGINLIGVYVQGSNAGWPDNGRRW
jgi:hypothetical protein